MTIVYSTLGRARDNGPLTIEKLRDAMEEGLKPPEPRVPVLTRSLKRQLQVRRFRRAAEIMEEDREVSWEDAFERADRDCYGIACALG